jgi:aspartate kinase
MRAGNVVIVAGFQGVAQTTKDVTTLGRGASDTTAVALAAAMDADYCEIYTDVDGIFTADPRIVPTAQRIPRISYEEMLELAASGAKVLHLRCVEYARAEHVSIHVRSSFSESPGTWVTDRPLTQMHISAEELKKGLAMEQAIISGVAQDASVAKITIAGVPDEVGVAARLFFAIAAADVNVDMIVQNASRAGEGRTDISFTLPMDDADKAKAALDQAKADVGFQGYVYNDHIAKVSVVGIGIRTHPGVAAKLFEAMAAAGVNLDMIATSEIRISVMVEASDMERAVKAAHTAFGLDADGEAVVYAATGR